MEREDWETIQGVMHCRNYRRAHSAFHKKRGRPSKGQIDLLDLVGKWRNEADARD